MSRSLSYLRRGLLGLAFVGSLGFGATQALANPDQQRQAYYCEARGYPYSSTYCRIALKCTEGGYCREDGLCNCGHLP